MNGTGVLVALATVFIVVAVVIGGYVGGWWLKEDSVNRNAEIQRNSYNMQETSRDEVVDQAADLLAVDAQLADPSLTPEQSAVLSAQREGMRRQLCSVASNIQGSISPSVNEIITKEC